MSDRHGVKSLGRLGPEDRSLIEQAYQQVRGFLPRDPCGIHWINLFLNRAHRVDYPLRDAVHQLVTGLVRRAFSAWPEPHLLSYGFTVNPSGNPHLQKFHYDYTPTVATLFVPLTKVTLLNAPYYLSGPLQKTPMDAVHMLGDIDEIMDKEGLDAIEVHQLVCRPWTMFRFGSGTPHAGIPNRDDYDRVLFTIAIDEYYHELEERTVFKLYEDESTFRADMERKDRGGGG